MKLSLTTLFFLLFTQTAFSCLCSPSSFCHYYGLTIDLETTLIFMGSYLNEEGPNDWDKAVQYKVEKIYTGEIVTETSIYYDGEIYVNTDSTVWLESGSESFCGRQLDDTTAIFLVTYNQGWLPTDGDIGYVPTSCEIDYLPISNNDEITGWIFERQDTTITLDEFETLIKQGCGTTTTFDPLADFNQISVFPNPVNDILSINYPAQFTEINIELYDHLGNLVKKSNRTNIDMNNLNTGVYFVKVYNQHSSYTEKIIKI